MMINQDYIISEISSLGSDNFDIVISFVLKDILFETGIVTSKQWL